MFVQTQSDFAKMRSLIGPVVLASAAVVSASSNYTCLPGDSCWPTLEQWTTFNESVAGALKVTHPMEEPCYADSSSEACQAVAAAYTNLTGAYRTSFYGETVNLNWEYCGNDQCLLESLAPLEGISGTCKLGRLSAYYVDAQTADQVAATLKFVQEHSIRLSIKNTGHDYFGRSTTANSLALWVHNMQDISYAETFTPEGCSTERENVGIIGAGVEAATAYTFFADKKMHVTVGAVASVGIAGGFGQGGGHGALGPSYGLMVDQAIEFDVVTADGELQTINECTDSDLFWAMRGGGGSTYAVLLNYKFQLHPAVPMNVFAFTANLTETPTNISESTIHRDIVAAIAKNQTQWANNNVSGYNFFLPYNIISVQILPSADTEALKTLTKDYANFLSNLPGLDIIANEYATLDTYPEYTAFALPFLGTNGPLGVGITEAARLIPRTLFETDDSVDALVEAFLYGMQTSLEEGAGLGTGSGQIYHTGPSNNNDESDSTGVNPAWRGSLWHVIHGGIWTKAESQEERAQIQTTAGHAIQKFKDLTPGGGSYLNEGDVNEEDWQQTFFGDKYDRLLGIKQKYDPTGLFNCFKCVGWTGAEDPFYSCYKQEGQVPTIPLDASQNTVTAS
ncbi:Uu.00g019780.m01.CDS01 [Anthostomella pinea]|uniref:Uu.00g019780.m01.CDS01 n=1 Tax=Anthostomella pinea TaxID=933095 RepID=A0AAI8W000_9PEZI|nr:Uu.00g019780.m01.CDS01 [Anthostomella pinea]